MNKITLGNTDSKVSEMSLGCLYFGSSINEELSFKMLDYYYEIGGRFLDTSNNYAYWLDGYNGGESETLLGKWMKERGNRKEIFLATKVGAQPLKGDDDWEGLSVEAIMNAVDKSLHRLGTDYIDLYYTHVDKRESPLEETLEALDKLVKMGKVRNIGCSNMLTWRIERARQISRQNSWAEFVCVEQRHSYLRPHTGADFGVQISTDEELLDYCRLNNDFTLIAYSPLLWGLYTRIDKEQQLPYNSLDTQLRLSALYKVAHATGMTPNQVVFNWIMQTTPKAIPITAASSMEQLKENLDSVNMKLTSEHLEYLNSAGNINSL